MECTAHFFKSMINSTKINFLKVTFPDEFSPWELSNLFSTNTRRVTFFYNGRVSDKTKHKEKDRIANLVMIFPGIGFK